MQFKMQIRFEQKETKATKKYRFWNLPFLRYLRFLLSNPAFVFLCCLCSLLFRNAFCMTSENQLHQSNQCPIPLYLYF
jgi:hypothetical protein